jgi:flagellin
MGGFSILTNVASLQAQNYLSANQVFQNQTIAEVTSGLRIVNSGDDAAGLAIANGFRSDEAVLTQGIQNANNGVAQLQIMDGGMSNISQLLDRARTLATQSASGTFTGSRTVLNDEYQSVLGEIDRQAQSIGLNQGGEFATNLSVFIGGGKGNTAQDVINNGTVSVDLSNATVDTQSLGLKGYEAGNQVATGAADSGLYDLSAGGPNSVSALIAANNTTGTTSFILSGEGFGASGVNAPVTVNVNLASVGDSASLVTAINAGIASAEAGGGANDQALATANITASIHTGADGAEQLVFTSPTTAFNVTAGDTTANALLGNLSATSGGAIANTGGIATADTFGAAIAGAGSVATFVAAGTQQTASTAFTTMAATDTQTLAFTVNGAGGAAQTTSVTLGSGTSTTTITSAQAVAAINAALQASDNPALQGIVASTDSTGGFITFSSNSPGTFNVTIGNDVLGGAGGTADALGFATPNTTLTSSVVGTGATSSILTQAGAEVAVSALANSVSTLGSAQAAVGRGENQFTYATNLAQSELTNEATAESDIRDANLATEAANLTKAQILLQAGVAALAQANAAPQNILALLKG